MPTTHTATPHLLLFDAPPRRELLRLLRRAHPGVHWTRERSWLATPRPRRGRAGVWVWPSDGEALRARASEVLLRFVYPLAVGGLPYCVAFPLAADALNRQPLAGFDRTALDLEDIATLLGRSTGRARVAPGAGRVRPAATGPIAAPLVPACADGLDQWQRAAVLHGRGPVRVLAPAGAGKTKTLISRVAELIARGVDPGAILLLAFNRMAAEQFEERLAALGIATTRHIRGAHPHAVHCATFNAFGSRYQKEVAGRHLALDADGSAQRSLMRRALEESGYALGNLKPTRGSDPVGAFLTALVRVRTQLEPPASVSVRMPSIGDAPCVVVPFAAVHGRFTELQTQSGRTSFDDQVYLALADMLASPRRRAFVQERYPHVLVDEFQDLSGAQLALIDVLSRPWRDLFAVGDDDQLIYGWRHADASGILDFHERHPPQPWSATYALRTNYRCSRAVVAAGNRLIANNRRREAKCIAPRDAAAEGSVDVFCAPTWPERAAAVCDFLSAERARSGCTWRALAVLCRFRAQLLPLALALDACGIPRSALLGHRLFSHPAARLLHAYIRLTLDPPALKGADLRLLANRPERYARSTDVASAAAAACPWARLLEMSAPDARRGPQPLRSLVAQVTALHDELTGVKAHERPTAQELVWAVVDRFALEDHWEALEMAQTQGASEGTGLARYPDATGHDGAGRFQVLDALLLVAESCRESTVFLAEWERLCAAEEREAAATSRATPPGPPADDRVVIETIHAAKGREYRSVVIPEYSCEVSCLAPDRLEEERRVLYVGVTRAQEAVFITCGGDPSNLHPLLRELLPPADGRAPR